MKKILTGVAGLTLVLLISGCRSTQPHFASFDPAVNRLAQPAMVTVTNRLDPSWLQAPTNLFTLGPGDKLEIELFDDPLSKTTTVIGPDGKIYFNLLPGIDVWGMTIGQAKATLEQNLTRYIRGTPRVNLTLREIASKRVWLLGRFQSPGLYTMAAPTTLLEAISMAGGSQTFTGTKDVSAGPLGEDLADLKHSFVVREGKFLPVDIDSLLHKGDISQNIYLQPDDFVYFSPAYTKQVYVLGAVVQPRPVIFTEGMTLVGAIAGAYGTIRDAYLFHVVLLRGSLSQPQITVVDYKAVVHGEAPDIALEPQDIVYVPFAPYRYLRKYMDIALNTFVSSVAINAGSHLVAPGGTTSTGIFIPVGSGIQVTPPPAPPIH
jgi:polysaccharide export outer membrane protein